jgi:hypothetical protein
MRLFLMSALILVGKKGIQEESTFLKPPYIELIDLETDVSLLEIQCSLIFIISSEVAPVRVSLCFPARELNSISTLKLRITSPPTPCLPARGKDHQLSLGNFSGRYRIRSLIRQYCVAKAPLLPVQKPTLWCHGPTENISS